MKNKLGKYDVVCCECGQVIKGYLRETSAKGDYTGMMYEDEKGYHHGRCPKAQKSHQT